MIWWWLSAAFLVPLMVTAVALFVAFGMIRRSIDIEAASLDQVELDSGRVTMTVRFEDFRSDRLVRSGLRRNPARAVLTSTHLRLIERPQHYGIFERADLPRFTVATVDGALRLRSTDPPHAVGTITYRLPVGDPDEWVGALVRAGARPEPAGPTSPG